MPKQLQRTKSYSTLKPNTIIKLMIGKSRGVIGPPVQLSHAFDEAEQIKSEVVVKSVLQMVESFEERYLEKKRIKNGHIMDSIKTSKCYTNLKKTLIQFTSEKYNKSIVILFY